MRRYRVYACKRWDTYHRAMSILELFVPGSKYKRGLGEFSDGDLRIIPLITSDLPDAVMKLMGMYIEKVYVHPSAEITAWLDDKIQLRRLRPLGEPIEYVEFDLAETLYALSQKED